MGRGAVAVIIALLFVAGGATVALAQYGTKPEAPKPSVAAPAGEGKQPVEKMKTVTGKVRSVDTATLVVQVSGKAPKEYAFALAGSTIKVGGKEGTSTDLKQGDVVRVSYTDADGRLTAKTVIAGGEKAGK